MATVAEPYRVLFVDDDPLALSLVKRIFEVEEDIEVVTTTDPNEALSVVATRPIELVVADQRMPTVQGLQLLARVREVAPGAMRFLLTGYPEVNIALEGINKGLLHRLLLKPWDPDEMVRTVRSDLERKRSSEGERIMADLMRNWFVGLVHSERAVVAQAVRAAFAGVPVEIGPSEPGDRSHGKWDLSDAVRTVVSALRRRFGPSGPRLELTALRRRDDPGEEVAAILLHLLLNALDATPADRRGDITVRSYRDRQQVVLEVVTPVGPLAPEIERRLFTPFATGQRGRIGLGLATSQKRAERLGGRIAVSRNDADGVGFRLELPMYAAAASRPPASR